MFFPPDMTDQMQPLDTHGYSAVKKFVSEQVRSLSDLIWENRVRENIDRMKEDIKAGKKPTWERLHGPSGPGEGYLSGLVASTIRGALLNSGNIGKGFEDNGLFPLCPEKILSQKDFEEYQRCGVRSSSLMVLFTPMSDGRVTE